MKAFHSWCGSVIVFLQLVATASAVEAVEEATSRRTIRVPLEHATIQAAIDAAEDGDTVLVSPGVYREGLRLAGKSIRLVSEFEKSGDKRVVRQTVLDGKYSGPNGQSRVRDQVVFIDDTAGPKTEIVGFTIRNGDDGIRCSADVRIAHNYFTGNDDAIDYEGGGGLCEYNKFEKNTDDAVDYDLDSDVTVVHNEIVDNGDDGIEIRLHDYRGKTLHLTIRDNIIVGNREDGIQIIDYPGMSDRRIRIERNLIARNSMAGIGCMGDANSTEDYRAADIPEPIEVINNTIADNEYGITGGDNLVAINNVLLRNKQLGMKQVDGQSIASHNLFWGNGQDFDKESNVRRQHTLQVEPQLNKGFRPTKGSPCLKAGVSHLTTPSGTIEIHPGPAAPSSEPACDLGAFGPRTQE